MYHDTHGHLPPASVIDNNSTIYQASHDAPGPLLILLPYCEEANKFVQFNQKLGISHPDNAGVAETIIPVFLCPSMQYDLQDTQLAPSSYGPSTSTNNPAFYASAGPTFHHNGAIIVPVDKASFSNPLVRYKVVTDGLTHTFAFGEKDYFGGVADSGPSWAGGYVYLSFGSTYGHYNPDTLPPSGSQSSKGIYYASFRSDHPGGAHFVMLDGSVHFIADEIEDATLDALVTRAGGEVVADFQ